MRGSRVAALGGYQAGGRVAAGWLTSGTDDYTLIRHNINMIVKVYRAGRSHFTHAVCVVVFMGPLSDVA